MSGGRFQGDLPDRTFEFARHILELVADIPDGTVGWVLGKQLARSGTSIGANVREADHAISDAEFIQRCSIARREASETQYWLELCERSGMLASEQTGSAAHEAHDLMRILSSIVKKSQKHVQQANRAQHTRQSRSSHAEQAP